MFSTRFVQPDVPLAETSIKYAIMSAPPSFEGAVQESEMLVGPNAVADSPVGASGAVIVAVVALATLKDYLCRLN